jgi:alkylated DNA repair dioxygenase AlkB
MIRELSTGSSVALFPSIMGVDPKVAFERLLASVPWKQNMFMATPVPRLTAWYGDPGAVYTYSRQKNIPLPWTSLLADLRDRVAWEVGNVCPGWMPNSVLLNRYRSGSDSVAWHADNEPELGPETIIASVSLGAARDFLLKPRVGKRQDRVKLTLEHGSLLIMYGRCQADWLHTIPKVEGDVGERINLTFRLITHGRTS